MIMRIDAFCHIFAREYLEVVRKKTGMTYTISLAEGIKTLHDLDARFRVMDKFSDTMQVFDRDTVLDKMGKVAQVDIWGWRNE